MQCGCRAFLSRFITARMESIPFYLATLEGDALGLLCSPLGERLWTRTHHFEIVVEDQINQPMNNIFVFVVIIKLGFFSPNFSVNCVERQANCVARSLARVTPSLLAPMIFIRFYYFYRILLRIISIIMNKLS